MSLEGKTVWILAEDLYQELEIWYPLLRLREEGADVFVVGSGRAEEHKSKLGYPVKVDLDAPGLSGADCDAIVIPGGYAPDHMRRYPDMIRLVSEAAAADKVVASICHGGWMLTSANVVRGKRVTSFFAIKDDLVHAGADFVDEEVVVDGKLITSRKPEDLPAFCRELIRALRS
ncbi:MAG: type 1 glutamine amidotransferase [Deltaproteobacteria bacterium]|nr:type 1 glutamine amidotransferase [Deltaproteobacteria bacterium]